MATVVLTERCQTCNGRGEVPMHYPDGRGGAVCNWERCRTCKGTGRIRVVGQTPDPEPTRTLEVGGFTVVAPTFRDAAQFDRAVHRAHCDGLRVEATDLPGQFAVTNPTTGATYGTTRETCTCTAGQAGMPCKHVAAVVFELDVCEGRELPAPAIVAEAA